MAAYKVGLTGGIASGKSTVANLFSALGVPVIDADEISRELLTPNGPLVTEIAHKIGSEFIDPRGNLKRRELRNHIFSNPSARQQLNAIMHPAIRRQMLSRADACRAPYVLLVVPLLVETHLDALMDRVLVVDLPEALQIQRLCQRDGITAKEAKKILAAQASREQRLAIADDILTNEQEIGSLRGQVEKLHQLYQQLAAKQSLK